jgi:predicted secreted protein
MEVKFPLLKQNWAGGILKNRSYSLTAGPKVSETLQLSRAPSGVRRAQYQKRILRPQFSEYLFTVRILPLPVKI